MTLNPAILALLASSALIALMVLYAAWHGLVIIRRWDIRSGSELQLRLERRTYLVSTLLINVMAFEVLSLLLFVYAAESMHQLFVGAMCAAGVLAANPMGYPALILKVMGSMLAGVWLILNYTDNRALDYPLIRVKYALLLAIAPVSLAEAGLLYGYLLNLKADVITSCCGTLFSAGGAGGGEGWYFKAGSALASLPPGVSLAAMFILAGLVIAVCALILLKGGGRGIWYYALAALSAMAFAASIAAVISAVSPYVYELPTHHCPFCLLQREYWFVGYPLYAALFIGTISGIGAGAVAPFRGVDSLKTDAPRIMRRLALISLAMFSAFSALAAYLVMASDLVM